MTSTASVARFQPGSPSPLSADKMVRQLQAAGVTHVIIVPDTYQESFIAALEAAPDLMTIYACTEDEAIAINAGLYASGHRPILTIQNNGLFACVNTIRGISLDGGVPTVMFIGQYGYKPTGTIEDSPLRMVRMLEPTLDTWGVHSMRLWSDGDLDQIPALYEDAMSQRIPYAFIIPIPTAA